MKQDIINSMAKQLVTLISQHEFPNSVETLCQAIEEAPLALVMALEYYAEFSSETTP